MANTDCANCSIEKRMTKAEERLEKGDKKFQELQIAINEIQSDSKLDNQKIYNQIEKLELTIVNEIKPLKDDLTARNDTKKDVKRKLISEIIGVVVGFIFGGGLVALIIQLVK
ncbi:MAG: hypothetical protein RR327_05070 [Clostridia bacterium]